MLSSMRSISICFAVTAAAALLFAQRGSGPDVTYKSAADVASMIAKAKGQYAAKAQPTIVQNLLSLAPYKANLEYRAMPGPAAVHEKEAELFYVIDGAGVLTTGGKLTGESRTNAENLTGTGIEGGHNQPVSKGDVAIVPENTPHQFTAVTQTLVLMSFHVPRPVPGGK
jgi:mannose-6-phosphate isomerase-like protein (cupin superfamily)